MSEYEAVRACAMRHYPRNLGTFLILVLIVAIHPFVLWGQPEILSLILSC